MGGGLGSGSGECFSVVSLRGATVVKGYGLEAVWALGTALRRGGGGRDCFYISLAGSEYCARANNNIVYD